MNDNIIFYKKKDDFENFVTEDKLVPIFVSPSLQEKILQEKTKLSSTVEYRFDSSNFMCTFFCILFLYYLVFYDKKKP